MHTLVYYPVWKIQLLAQEGNATILQLPMGAAKVAARAMEMTLASTLRQYPLFLLIDEF